MLTLLLGGARSGKSTLAVHLGERHDGPVTYVATATALDDDMAARIGRHRDERPAHWQTVEEPLDLARAIGDADGGLVLVDCLTLWTTNLIFDGRSDDEIVGLAAEAAAVAARADADVIAVSNEVGLGIHPDTELGRRYRDVHGWVNQRWAAEAARSFLLVAGRLLTLHDPADVFA
jgi:adenosylcobinamide kinase/adenosylcobinamide-phosphate guanylyltransferase